MKTLTVALGDRSYPIYIGNGLLANDDFLKPHIPGEHVAVVTNSTVEKLYREQLEVVLDGYSPIFITLPDGEQYKTLDSLEIIFEQLLQNRFDRNGTLIALGGGVIGDITGFAAASYQRGIHFIQIPTTLLAQVDSSVGGKTAVNHRLGKNMIGAFYQPRCVIADLTTLNTLPKRELAAGLAEVVKYGLITDAPFFAWLEKNISDLLQLKPAALEYAVANSCKNKSDIVSKDEREQGQRALLNLGHTFGHAIETFVQYKGWLHGEAIAVGMVMAAEFSVRCNWLDEQAIPRIRSLLQQIGLPVQAPKTMHTDDFIELMARDKKVIDSTLRLVLLKSIGHAQVCDDFDRNLLKDYLASVLPE
ncbi:MAG: 3-dehydroquinate synthase [Gammaproteobacteria bacterium]|nr:3-dehydroquinate synthase [Gammaproteobacteria bacterium]